MKWTIQDKEAGMSIQYYLKNEQQFSRRLISHLKRVDETVFVNGAPVVKLTERLRKGDVLNVHFPAEKKGNHMVPEPMALRIVYEDRDIIIVNKRAFMPCTPSPLYPNGTLANGLLYYYQKYNIPYTVHVVTRLDKNTSGLVLIAKNRFIHGRLSDQLKSNGIKRKYFAILRGNLSEKQGTIDAPIGRKDGSLIERAVIPQGQRAITHYKIIKEKGSYTLADVQLETGRTHQIRVHFSHVGHPLVGDTLYSDEKPLMNRHALHCYELSFRHPISGKPLSFKRNMPKDMDDFFNGRQIYMF